MFSCGIHKFHKEADRQFEDKGNNMKVLVLNAGSSSIKYQLYQMPQAQVLAKGVVEMTGQRLSKLSHSCNDKTYTTETKVRDHEQGMDLILQTLVHKDFGVLEETQEIEAVGHRVVHGGEEFTGSVLIDEKVVSSIEKFADLAPLHNPHNLAGIRAARDSLANAGQVACFDTAFHSTIPQTAYMYALPYELYENHHVRRYGFHGTSHRYVARRAAALMNRDKYDVNLVTCHLGNGCSITAVKNGKSVDTSMGFTPLEGVAMGTRSGDFDPAILFYLAGRGYDMKTLNTLCNKQSGLLGISGQSNDMRNLSTLAENGNVRAQLAIDMFCYRVKKHIGAYTAILDRLDAIVFTGGIGENAATVRSHICSGLGRIGIQIDNETNSGAIGTECKISTDDSKVKIFVIPTNEEEAIAKDTYELFLQTVKSC